jgi:tryptophanyl-tRNA synthetase
MSKSESHIRGHAILLVADPDEIRYVIGRAVTDSGVEIVFSEDPEKAGINNLLEIYELLTAKSRGEIESYFAGKGYDTLKDDLAEIVIEALQPIRERYNDIIADPAQLEQFLNLGAERARSVAAQKLAEVKEKVGLIVP